jgi:hypothetical protein
LRHRQKLSALFLKLKNPKKPKAQKALLVKSLTRLGAVIRARESARARRARDNTSEREKKETDKPTEERERESQKTKNSRRKSSPALGQVLYKKLCFI